MAAFAHFRKSSAVSDDEDSEDLSDDYIPQKYLSRGQHRKIAQANVLEERIAENMVSTDGYHKYYSLSLKLVSAFCENVVVHPFVVLRRQCQVHRTARRYHLLPLTLIPIIIHIQGRQGLGTLWKGIGSIFIVKGLVIVFEDVLSKISHFPKEPSRLNSIKLGCQHLVLKFAALVMVTPFYSASLVETVQSDIASEKPGVIGCVTEGLGRIVPRKHNPTSTIVPVWSLAVPTAVHGVLRYAIGAGFQRLAMCCFTLNRKRKRRTSSRTGAVPRQLASSMETISYEDSPSDWGYTELTSALIGSLASDILFYPLETIMHRLHVQGTRTIVDSLDTGHQVVPLVTRYEGTLDCFRSVIADEGAAGLFKGFGALLLQYVLHAAILKLTKSLLDEIERNYGTVPMTKRTAS